MSRRGDECRQEANDGSGRAVGRSRGRARGMEAETNSSSSHNIGRGRGPGSSGDAETSYGRGVRRGMERGRATLDEVEEIEERLRKVDLTSDGLPKVHTIAPRRMFHESVLTDDVLHTADDNVKPKSRHAKANRDMKAIALQTNVLFIQTKPKWQLYSYRVDFKPDLDDTRAKKFVLKQHADEWLGGQNRYLFDGTKMWAQQPVHELHGSETFKLPGVDILDGTNVKTRFKFIEAQDENNPIAMQIYNLHLKRFQEYLDMKEIRRNFYFPNLAREVTSKGHKFQVWPGLVGRINRFERMVDLGDGEIQYKDVPGLLLDTTSKVVRQENCYEVIKALKRTSKGPDFIKEVKKNMVGSSVLTSYNNEYYRIDDVDFDNNPDSTFEKRGEQVSYTDYYKTQYNIKIKDRKQPLFICRPKKRRPGENRNISLIPELVSPTGLTDAMRTDFTIMRDLAQFTRRTPDQRYNEYKKIYDSFQTNEKVKEAMKMWGIRFDKTGFARANGWMIAPQDLQMSKRGNPVTVKGTDKADWDRDLKTNGLLKPPKDMKKWAFIGNKKAEKEGTEFAKAIVSTCKQQGWNVKTPQMDFLNSDRDLVKRVKEYVEKDAEFILCFVPRENKMHYDAVKKMALQSGMASQFVKEKTIKKNMQAVATKVALQMACKFGGEPWSVAMPPHINKRPVMFIGIDVYHDTAKKNDSVYALVASTNKEITRWYSTHQVLGQTEETPGNAVKQMIQLAIGAYRAANGFLPGNVLVFRDGVGDTDLARVKYQEVDAVLEQLDLIAENEKDKENDGGKIEMMFSVIQKRIDHKFMKVTKKGCENPPAGTICDTVLTKNIWYDFFLVSQLTRQGTVTPIHVNVIHDTVGLAAEKLQMLTFKLCHLYYNWPGTVRVPAPVQYAHKLAQLIGDSVHAGVDVDPKMKDKLFYL